MRIDVFTLAAFAFVTAASCGAASAQTPPPPGAVACSGCHAGPDSALPTLRGKSVSEIEAAMAAFRSGASEATVMDRIAKGFSSAETSAIAVWLVRNGGAK